jgi:hypothetical protein
MPSVQVRTLYIRTQALNGLKILETSIHIGDNMNALQTTLKKLEAQSIARLYLEMLQAKANNKQRK